ncbi:MAG: LysM peptidoglycan-binding domain-containing protein [Pseudomonadota bacterium]
MLYFEHFSVARISSGITAIVCAGFLVNAILEDNGGEPGSQKRWLAAMEKSQSFVGNLSRESIAEWHSQQKTGSISKPVPISTTSGPVANVVPQKRPNKASGELSVLSLIRANSEIAPPVSSGTDRVSVLVKKGDTLYSIAKRHGMQVNELARLNSLLQPYTIKVGQPVYIAR